MARIMVVDDDAQIRNMLCKMLKREGHNVSDATNGVQAIRRYREEPTDLVITDIIMPDKEGIETIMELKRDYSDVKIIAISGGGRIGPNSYLQLAKKCGAERTFFKPFDRTELIQAINDLVS